MPIRSSRNLSKVQLKASSRKLEYDIPVFGGLVNASDSTSIGETMSPDTLNTIYDTVESVGSRKGYIKVLTTAAPGPILGMHAFYKSDGTKQLIYGSTTGLYRYNNAGAGLLLTGAPGSFTTGLQWSFDTYLDQMVGGNGTDPLIAYNGTAYSIANAGITPQYVKVRKNRVYCVNKNSSTLYFSDPASTTSFPVNNFIQINTNDGQNITGLEVLLDNLVIFKDNSIWVLSGEPLGAGNTTTIGNLQLRQANSPVGCTAFRTIQKTDQGALFFMHYSGLWVLQNYTATLVSRNLDPLFMSRMNPGFLNLCWGIYNSTEKRYLLGFPSTTATVCDSALMFDFSVSEFSLWDHYPGSCGVNYKFSGNTDSMVMGDPSLGNIYQLQRGYADIAGDNGTATGGSTTTLIDTTKSWTTNQFKDCRIRVISGLNTGYTSVVVSNTSNTITFSPAIPSSPTGNAYTIGYYDSYWKSKIFDFNMTGNTKKYKYFNIFADSAGYNLLFGYAVDFAPLSYQKQIPLSQSYIFWGASGITWGQAGITWGTSTSVFLQANMLGTGRYIQVMFGNNLANQPWRVIKYGMTYKLKKQRPNIVAV